MTDCFQVGYRPILFGSSSRKKVLKKTDEVSMIFPHKKAVPERHASESRQECENKRKVGENTLCLSNCFFFSKSFDHIF